MTMRSPQRKRGAGAARHLACALLITVHAPPRASRRGHSQRARRRERAAGEHRRVRHKERRGSCVGGPPDVRCGTPRISRRWSAARCSSRCARPRAVLGLARAVFGYLLPGSEIVTSAAPTRLRATTPSTIFRAWRPGWCRKRAPARRATSDRQQHQNGRCPSWLAKLAPRRSTHFDVGDCRGDGHDDVIW